ncbi:MAG: hypothetical protein WD965_09805 [Actinomycetota bacterium]
MIKRMAGIVVAAAISGLLVLPASAALAHEGRNQGDLQMVVGFGTEPAYAGQPNSVQLFLAHDGEPVVDLGDTLDVEISFGDQTKRFTLEPNFAVGAFGEPGDYRAWFIPTRAGQYTFHLAGTIQGEDVDQTFTSGPRTFSDVEDPKQIQFPVQDPTNGELAERIDREVPRLTSATEEARTAATVAVEDAQAATDDASSAQTFAILAFAVGALGVALAAGALLFGRKRAT